MLSLVVLAWDLLPYTQACVESLRRTTDVPYELIIVDNGSAPNAASWAKSAADIAVLHHTNLGFAQGMNAGLRVASGEVVGFINNDTVWPDGWTTPVLEHFDGRIGPGIVAPAVTAAGNPVTVRERATDEVITLDPFSALPSGVAYFMPTGVIRALGGWTERYRVAMSEDLDLCFTCWVNDLDVVIDARTVVDHRLHATIDAKIDHQGALRRENLERFLRFWTRAHEHEVPRLPGTAPERFARNLRHARAAATWIDRLDDVRANREAEIAQLRSRLQVVQQESNGTPLSQRIGRRLRKVTS